MVIVASPIVNQEITRLADLRAANDGKEGWNHLLNKDGRNRALLISANPGAPPDPHIHSDFNEFWIMLDGETEYQIGQYEPFTAKWGDVVIAPAGYRHDIRSIGTGPWNMRLVVGPQWSNHDIKGIEPSKFIPLPHAEPANLIHTSYEWMLARHGTGTNWGEEVVLDQRNRVNFIHSIPGSSNNPHWHPDFDEWWVVLKGELEWRVGKKDPFRAGPGDVVFVEKGYRHEIVTVSDESAVRLAVTNRAGVHIYDGDDPAPKE